MKAVEVPQNKSKEEKLTKEEIFQFISISGQISWVASQTTPDIAVESCKITSYGKNIHISYPKQANKTKRKLKSKDVEITILNVGDTRRVEIVYCTDAKNTSLNCGSSLGSMLHFITYYMGLEKLSLYLGNQTC